LEDTVISSARRLAIDAIPACSPLTVTLAIAILFSLFSSACGNPARQRGDGDPSGQGGDSGPAGHGGDSGAAPEGIHGFFSGFHGGGGADGGAGH
jgi:hypothetical protein